MGCMTISKSQGRTLKHVGLQVLQERNGQRTAVCGCSCPGERNGIKNIYQPFDTQGHPVPVLNCVYKKIKDHHDDDDIYIPMMMICEMLPG
jgi:hypothetical protein